MAKNRSDVELRVRSRNDAKRDLAGLNDDLEKLIENQKRQADSSVLAARSLKQLTDEQRALESITKELGKRRDLIEKLIGDRAKVAAAPQAIRRLKDELQELLSIKARGINLGDIDGPIKRVREQITAAEKDFQDGIRATGRLGDKLRGLGVDTADLSGELARVTAAAGRSQAAFEAQIADVNRLDAAQEEAARSARKLGEAQRFAAEQAARTQGRRADAVAGFAGLDQFERQAAAARAAEAAQQRQNEAAQRSVDINERLNAVLARRPGLQPFSDRVAGAGGIDGLQRQEAAERALQRAREEGAAERQRAAALEDRIQARRQANARFNQVYVRQEQQGAAATRATTGAIEQKTAALRRNTAAAQQNRGAFNWLVGSGNESLSVYQRLRGEVLAMAVAYGGLYQVVNQVNQALIVSQQRAAINARLMAANGNNARLAARDQAFLRAEAERLGFVYDDLAKYYANFAIAAKANGIADRDIKAAFSQAATSVRGLALSTADADGVFRAFEQIFSKSRVTAEELRGQLGERLPGAVKAFADSYVDANGKVGISLAELDDKLRAGEVSIENLMAFLKDYAKDLEVAADIQSKTVFADINRLKTAYKDFLQLFIEGEASEELRKVVIQLTEMLKGPQGQELAKSLGAGLAELLRILQFVIENFETLVFVAKAFAAAMAATFAGNLLTSLWGMVAAFGRGAKALWELNKAARAAAAAGTAMTFSNGKVVALMGPLGIAIAGVVVQLGFLANAYLQASQRAEQWAKTSRVALSAQDSASAELALRQLREDLKLRQERLRVLKDIQERGDNFNPVTQFETAVAQVREGVVGPQQLEAEITEEKFKQRAILDDIAVLERRISEFRADEAAAASLATSQEEAAAKAAQEAANAANSTGTGDDAAKAARDAERQRRAEETSANARANASRALQKQILDLDQQIFDARIDGEARTAEEIEQGFKLRLEQIKSELAELNLGADALEQNARRAGGGTVSSSDAAAVDAVRQRIETFGVYLEKQAESLRYATQVQVAEKAVNDLIAERDAKISAINTQAELGLKTEVEARREALAVQQEYAGRITANINSLIALLKSLPPDVFAKLGGAALVTQLEEAALRANVVKTELQFIAENLGGQFAQGAASAFGVLAEGIAGAIQGTNSLGDAFEAAGNAMLSFVADFLVNIGKAILQAIILQAIMNAINGGSGGYAGAALSALGVPSNHDGGIVGQDGKMTWAPADAFRNAKRYHDGGLPGLKSNEVPTILERGEEVVTADDPRHVLNGGMGAAPAASPNITMINTIDSPSVVEAGLPSKAGTRVLINTIQANRQQIRNALGMS